MRVDLERLRESVRHVPADGWSAVRQPELAALLAVVDAARNGVRAWSEGAYSDIDVGSLEAALEPFGPERPDRAWEEVDRWHAERDRAVKAAVDATPKPSHSGWAMLPEQPLSPEGQREWTRDYVALVGEVVQRQFRSDQERIAELERERDALRKELDARRADVRELETTIAEDAADTEELVDRVEALKRERDEWKGRHKAVTNGLSNHVARADQAEERLARVPALVEALRRSHPSHRPRMAARCTICAILAEWEKP